MRMNRRIPTTMLMALVLAACEGSEGELDGAQSLRTSDDELRAAACPEYRQIARLGSGVPSCPARPGWTESAVFPSGPGELAEFCQYRWNGDPDNVDLTALEQAGDVLAGFSPDCEVVLSQGTDAIWALVGADVEALFHHGIGRATPSDLALPSSESSRSPVVVAVVDSVPEPAPTVPRSEHGELMVSLINDIACPDAGKPCKVSVRRSLGLPRISHGQIDPIHGGYKGSQADIAKAIYAVVHSWQTYDWNGDVPKLVINMSVGWDGDVFGDTDDPDMRPPVDAVYTAIEHARCLGALVVAAAGNEGDLCSDGALLPGEWEKFAAPTAARCAELGVANPPGGAGYRPLLYSVGGLTHDHDPMPGTRALGMPRLAALATHAVAGGDSTALTGTSVSSATAAGIAALVWSYNPDLAASEVMAAVYVSGDPTGLQADYVGPGTSATGVRAIDACAALEFACNLPNSNCPATPFATPLTCLDAPAPLDIADVTADLAALTLPPDHDLSPIFGPEIGCPAACGEPAVGHLATGVNGSPCPDPIVPVLPYTEPQPTQIGCPNCTLDIPTSLVHATLDPAFEKAKVLEVSVILHDGARAIHLDYGDLPLSTTEVTRIAVDPLVMPDNVESAEISIAFDTLSVPVVDDLLINP